MRELITKLTLLLVAVAVGLVLSELGLRLYFWTKGVGRSDVTRLLRLSARADPEAIDATSVFGIVRPSPWPDVVYELRPNVRGLFRAQPFSTNQFGIRGPAVTRRKPPGVRRVVGLGDSYMFGWGVAQDEFYLALLERRFAASSPAVQFLNFGTPGYNTAMQVALYENKVRYFEPDLVLVHFVGNDLALPHHLQPPRDFAPANWYLFELLRAVFAPKALDGELELLPHDLTTYPEDVQEDFESRYDHMLGAEGYRRAMARLAELTGADSVPVLVMSLGPRELVDEVAEEHGFSVLEPSAVFAELMEARGIEVTRANWRSVLRLPGDIHPSPFAHEAYAEAIARELAKRGFAVPGSSS